MLTTTVQEWCHILNDPKYLNISQWLMVLHLEWMPVAIFQYRGGGQLDFLNYVIGQVGGGEEVCH